MDSYIEWDVAACVGNSVELMSGVRQIVMLEDPDTFNRVLRDAMLRILGGTIN